jgi:hypothetical protein
MDLEGFFREGFGAHDLADALLELGRDDQLDASNTKVELAHHLASMNRPLERVLNAFYELALSNACAKFGLPTGRKSECVARLLDFAPRPNVETEVKR